MKSTNNEHEELLIRNTNENLYFHAAIANDVYYDRSKGNLPGGFVRIDQSGEEPEKSGFFAAAYKGKPWGTYSNTIIIAYRGTDNVPDIFRDYNVFQEKVFDQCYEAIDYARKIARKQYDSGLRISFTGHSLGAALAQIPSALYNGVYRVFRDDYLDSHEWNYIDRAIVFESPGVREIIKKIAIDSYPHMRDWDNMQDFESYGIGSSRLIQSHTNAINTCGDHGYVFMSRMIHLPYDFENIPNRMLFNPYIISASVSANTYYLIEYTISTHIMDPIVEYLKNGGELEYVEEVNGLQAGYVDYLDTTKNHYYWNGYLHKCWEYSQTNPVAPHEKSEQALIQKGFDWVDQMHDNGIIHARMFDDCDPDAPNLGSCYASNETKQEDAPTKTMVIPKMTPLMRNNTMFTIVDRRYLEQLEEKIDNSWSCRIL